MKMEDKNTDIHSASVQEILGTPPHWIIRNGIMLVFAIIAVLFLCSHFINCPDIITAPLTIMDDESQKGEIFLPVQFAKKIKSGQTIKIKIDEYPYMDFGVIEIIPNRVSMFFYEDASNGKICIMEITVPDSFVTDKGIEINLRPKMTGTVEITINNRTLLNRLLDPIRAVLKREK